MSVVTAALLAVGLASPASAAFTDVPVGSYYEDAVDWMEDQEITTGTTATTFSPDWDVTRGMFATFLWRFAGEPAPTSSTTSFTDVPAGAFYTEAVAWLAETGITTGTTATTFSPADVLDRAQAATFFWRYMCEPDATSASAFTDVVAGSYYEEAVDWMAENEITTGTTASTYSPAMLLNRAQSGTFMHRLAGTPDVGDAGENRSYDCSDEEPPPPVESDLLGSVTSVSFGDVGVTATAPTSDIVLTNDGDADITVSTLTLDDTDGLDLTGPSTPFVVEVGDTETLTVSFDPDRVGDTSATLAVVHNGANDDLSIPVTGSGVASVVYRVNAGGPEIADTPVWAGDELGTPAAEHNLSDADDDRTTVSGATIDTDDPSIPDGTPDAVFTDDRWDNTGIPPMEWDIPLDNGTYLVRLYFVELFQTTNGARQFDVQLEGEAVLEGYDIHAEVGAEAGVAKAYVVDVADGSLDIDFSHEIDNPAIAAIEVLAIGETSSGYAMAVPTFHDYGSVGVSSGSETQEFSIENLGTTGDESITITSVATPGAAFTNDFSGPVVVAPGATATFDIVFDPTVAGIADGQALVTIDGSPTVIPIGLTGFGLEGVGATMTVTSAQSGNINASTYTTGSFVVVNTSETESISEIVIDVRTALIPDVAFDENDGTPAGDTLAKDFTVDANPCGGPTDISGVTSNPVGNGEGVLTISCSTGTFDPGETLAFSIDIDPATIQDTDDPGPNESGSVTGLELSGTTVTVDFNVTGTVTGKIFGDGTVGGGELLLVDETAPTTPVITIAGTTNGATTSTASQTVTVTGSGSTDTVELIHVEVGLYTTGATPTVVPGATDGNSVINDVDYADDTLSSGTATFNVTLVGSPTASNENEGLNYFIARVTDATTGRTSVSDVFILDYQP